tara:strand:- start:251 stop:472 length:222 start_codon:yes stop_codon:yes gene_type:complete
METKNELYSLEYYKHKCKVLQLQIDWLDELCNFERDSQYQLSGIDIEEWKEELEELEDAYYKECGKFERTYNV